MESYLNFVTDYKFNISETTTQSPVDISEASEWTDAEIARLIQVIVRPILLVVGTVGNGLTIYIMQLTSLKNVSSCFYMSLLAVADTSKWSFSLNFLNGTMTSCCQLRLRNRQGVRGDRVVVS